MRALKLVASLKSLATSWPSATRMNRRTPVFGFIPGRIGLSALSGDLGTGMPEPEFRQDPTSLEGQKICQCLFLNIICELSLGCEKYDMEILSLPVHSSRPSPICINIEIVFPFFLTIFIVFVVSNRDRLT